MAHRKMQRRHLLDSSSGRAELEDTEGSIDSSDSTKDDVEDQKHNVPHAEETFRFMDLPAELRNKIYCLCFPTNTVFTVCDMHPCYDQHIQLRQRINSSISIDRRPHTSLLEPSNLKIAA